MKLVMLSMLVMAIVGQVACAGGGSGSSTANYGSSSVNYGAGQTSSATFGGGSSVRNGGGSSFSSSGIGGNTASRGFSGGFGLNEAPRPYHFDYKSADEKGNSHYHREESDASGTVRGSYGYTNIKGLHRVVDYVADASGFRASIRTNEPGTDGKESPADVQMTVNQPPPFRQAFSISVTGRPPAAQVGYGGVSDVVVGTYKSGAVPTVGKDYD